MHSSIQLGILDQVAVFREASPHEAVQQAVALAEEGEKLGYTRFWVAEHHGDPAMACASPAVLLAAVAQRTMHIRVGAGCVLLPYTKPLKVAEEYRLLHALAPGRIDLGIGRGASAGPGTAPLLTDSPEGGITPRAYASSIQSLLTLLSSSSQYAATHPLAVPEDVDAPAVWLMGTGMTGALTAASLGMPFSFAHFLTPRPAPEVVSTYREAFTPSPLCPRPSVSIAVRVACATTCEDADIMANCLWMPAMATMKSNLQAPSNSGESHWEHRVYPSWKDAQRHTVSANEAAFRDEHPNFLVAGTPLEVADQLLLLASKYMVDELVLTTICPDVDLRMNSYRLIRDELLKRQDRDNAVILTDNGAT